MELWISNWRRDYEFMQGLGVRRGVDNSNTADPRRSATRLRGQIMVDQGSWVAIYNEDGPTEAHAVWSSDEPIHRLREIMSEDGPLVVKSLRFEKCWQPRQRRMVIIRHLGGRQNPKSLMTTLRQIYEEADGCLLHYHPMKWTRFAIMMDNIFDSATVNPQSNWVCLPNGRYIQTSELRVSEGWQEWVEMVGVDPDLVIQRGPIGIRTRRQLNICSAVWASENWHRLDSMTKPGEHPSWYDQVVKMGVTPEFIEGKRSFHMAMRKKKGKKPKASAGDMALCDACTLAAQCRLYRSGAICVLPESEMGELADKFKTRDSESILDALATLVGMEADRAEEYLESEKQGHDLAVQEGKSNINSEVTTMLNKVFDHGMKLAKLVDPKLASGPKVALNLTNTNVGQITAATPQQLVAAVVASLEAEGYRRDEITPALIEQRLGIHQKDVISATAVEAPALGVVPEQ
jgi:hypothetical protein